MRKFPTPESVRDFYCELVLMYDNVSQKIGFGKKISGLWGWEKNRKTFFSR